MALIVEDGTGKPDADSYVSVAACEAYAAAHGLAFAGEVPAQEAALRNATLYLDTQYTFRGDRKTAGQALEWPRTVEDLPREVVGACCELATRALVGQLWRDIDSSQAGAVTEETIGPITTKYAAAVGARDDGQASYPGVTAMLRRWLASFGSSVKLVRC